MNDMPNVVPFAKLYHKYACGCDFHGAIHGLDLALGRTRELIGRCPPGTVRDELESWLLDLCHLLSVARDAAHRLSSVQ
jgi:hypothetical protein